MPKDLISVDHISGLKCDDTNDSQVRLPLFLRLVRGLEVLRFRFLLDPDLDPESHPKELESESCGSGSTLDPNQSDPNQSEMIIYLALFWDQYIKVGPISVI